MSRPVSVIVLNYNGLRFLDDALTTLLAQEYPEFEVILVDNASKDGSAEYVRSNFPSVRILALDSNLGFAEGNNRGVDVAEHDLIVLLNNDVILERGLL